MMVVKDQRDGTLRRLASYASLSLAMVMLVMKATAWLLTGSIALLTSVVDSAVDLVASVVHLGRRPLRAAAARPRTSLRPWQGRIPLRLAAIRLSRRSGRNPDWRSRA